MVIDTINAEAFEEAAINALGERSTLLVELLQFESPIDFELFGGGGERLAAFSTASAETQFFCSIEQVWARSRDGASLLIRDGAGRTAEILLVIGRVQ
jgi:hypothetical protein